VITKHHDALRRLHLVLDAVVVVAAMAFAFWLHLGLRAQFATLKEPPEFTEYAMLAYLTLPLWLALVVVLDLHRSFERVWPVAELFTRLLLLHAGGLTGLAILQFLTQSTINRSIVALFLISSLLLMCFLRIVLSAWLRYQHGSGKQRVRVLLVGQPGPALASFIEHAGQSALPPTCLGYLDDLTLRERAVPVGGVHYLGELGQLEELLHAEAIDEVLFFPPYDSPKSVSNSLRVCETLGVPASFAIDLVQMSQATPRVSFEHDRPFVRYDVAPKHPEMLAIKHGLDLLLALCAVLLLSPLLLLTALAVLVSMGRPVIFAHDRAGLYGRAFRMYKFRTMRHGAEAERTMLEAANEMSGPVFKIANDPRITPLGRLLRKYSLDELPQLFNVLSGSMSLVGPRPLPVGEQTQIRGWQRRRLSMKPGVTGLWQVSGRNLVNFEEWMALDLQYVDEWSLVLDLTILMRTLPAVLAGRGAH
jgi:exopolysaccharide biosynthesis polyprenyl glycosylphosphotransferase